MMAKAKTNKTFDCTKCEKQFKTYNGYTNHKCVPKPKKKDPAQCKTCKRVFKTPNGLDKHKCVPKKKPETKATHICELCDAKYKTETGLINHKCKAKLRLEEYKRAEGRIGFIAYQQFYQRVLVRTNNQKEKSLIDYINSSYYKGFYKFGKYVVDLNMPYYHEYVDFLITYNIPLEKWTNDAIYDTYVQTQNKKENSERAVEKTFNTMNSWSKRTGENWKDYFIKEDKLKIINGIRTGKISPWVLYNSKTGQLFMQSLDVTDLNVIFNFIDPQYWSLKFGRHHKEKNAVEQVLLSCQI